MSPAVPRRSQPVAVTIGGFDAYRAHTAPGVLAQQPQVGDQARTLLRSARFVELVRPDHGLTVHGDMSGDLGAAYPGDHARPDLTAIEVAAVLEGAGVTVAVRDDMAGVVPASFSPDLRLMKVQLPTWRADLEEADRWRRTDPDVPVVLYGAVLSYLPQLDHSMTVQGDAPRALGDVLGQADVRIGYAYRLFPLDQYRSKTGTLTAHLQASRGCQRTCLYCPYIRINGRWSARDLIGLEHDLEDLAALRVDRIQFRDQDFASDASHAIAVASIIKKAGEGRFRWSVEGNLDRFTPDVLRAMIDAGCDEVIVGLESSDPDVLRNARRRVLNDTEERVETIAAAGPVVRGLFMVGLPEDNWSRVHATVRRALDLPLHAAQFNVYSPLPGEHFGTRESVTVEDFVPNSNNYRYRTCQDMSAMEVRLAAGLAAKAFSMNRSNDPRWVGVLSQIQARAEAAQQPTAQPVGASAAL